MFKCLSSKTNNVQSALIQLARRNFESLTSSTDCPYKGSIETPPDWENARPFNEIPGPTKFELIVGNLPGGEYYNLRSRNLFDVFRRKYGDFVRLPAIFGKGAVVLSFDPNIFREVFKNEGTLPARRNFEAAYYYREVYRKEYFQGVFGLVLSSGEPWAKFRNVVSPVFKQLNKEDYLPKLMSISDDFLQRIRDIRDPNTLEMPEEFVDDIYRLHFEYISAIAIDKEFGLIRRDRDGYDVQELFKCLRDFFILTNELDVKVSMWKKIGTPTYYKMMRVCEKMYHMTQEYIKEALQRLEKNRQSSSLEGSYTPKSIIEKIAQKDKTVALVMAMDFLLAGVDTSTTILTGILLGLSKNLEAQEKLREEVRRLLPEKDSVVTSECFQNIPYLKATFKEGLRMYPFGPGTLRTMPNDTVIGGYQIPKHCDVAVGLNLILREERYFRKPNEFKPERWLRTEEGNALKPAEARHPFVFLPFGYGPKSCTGRAVADLEMTVTLMRLVRNFKIEYNYSIEDPFDNEFITRPIIPLKFKFTELPN